MLKGIIFDIDGILLDSEPLHAEAFIEALRSISEKTKEIQPEKLIGLSLEETLEKLGICIKYKEQLKEKIVDYYIENLDKNMVRPDIRELWQKLIEQNIPFGCVSTAEMKICRANIGMLELPVGIEVPVVSCECIPETKPHPMPYITMMKRLGLAAEEIVVLEDSDIGIKAARAAGVENIYAWPHGLSQSQAYKAAKKVIKAIREVPFISEILSR